VSKGIEVVPARVEFTINAKFQFEEQYQAKRLRNPQKQTPVKPFKAYEKQTMISPAKLFTDKRAGDIADAADHQMVMKRQKVAHIPSTGQVADEEVIKSELKALT
jgi:hypothetical protein